jgi:ribosomal protein S27AE
MRGYSRDIYNAVGTVLKRHVTRTRCASCGASGVGSRRVEHRWIPCERCIKGVVIQAWGARPCAHCDRGFILSHHERTTPCGDCQGAGSVQRTAQHE